MDDDQYNDLLKDDKLARPANCDGLAVVKCNQLVCNLLPPNARTNDNTIQNFEMSVVKSATVLAKMVTKVATLEKEMKEKGSEDISFIIDDANDALTLLGQANRKIHLTCKGFVKARVEK
ncbi:hypothetical protein DPMN_036728 [Dreissena polymorpha]|uniref:Uncharacterized protein n=1 Tax=Dreissena polymorpha TaxID=45954 RepID=A0A9D4MDI7_DREPO|nr:hypothetical protein DPMN_036728 [Dreissena polymorpha]